MVVEQEAKGVSRLAISRERHADGATLSGSKNDNIWPTMIFHGSYQ